MKNFTLIFFLVSSSCFGQSLSSLNFNYLYDPQQEVSFLTEVVKSKDQVTVYFQLQTSNDQNSVDNYSINWERWESSSSSQGSSVDQTPTYVPSGLRNKKTGRISFPLPDKIWQLVAKVTNSSTLKSWSFVQSIEPKYPVNGWVEDEFGVVAKPYLVRLNQYTLQGANAKPLHVDFYKTNFDPAAPPFATKQAKPDRFMFPDSVFTIQSGSKVSFKKEGLYLVQEDTVEAEGFAFRVVKETFPRFTKIQDLAAPLILISTKEEYDQILDAKDDKAKFDKVILDITKDKDRAKNFMRSFFRRVELSNLYFSSYKEGWKTDRGMIYLIFGQPDEVSKTNQKEVWYYKTSRVRFTFIKAGSVYDPNQFTLVRDNNFMEIWFSTIDLWRKSRY